MENIKDLERRILEQGEIDWADDRIHSLGVALGLPHKTKDFPPSRNVYIPVERKFGLPPGKIRISHEQYSGRRDGLLRDSVSYPLFMEESDALHKLEIFALVDSSYKKCHMLFLLEERFTIQRNKTSKYGAKEFYKEFYELGRKYSPLINSTHKLSALRGAFGGQ